MVRRGACRTEVWRDRLFAFPPQQRLLASHPSYFKFSGHPRRGRAAPINGWAALLQAQSVERAPGALILLERGDVRRLKELKVAQRLRRETRSLRVTGFRASARPTPSWEGDVGDLCRAALRPGGETYEYDILRGSCIWTPSSLHCWRVGFCMPSSVAPLSLHGARPAVVKHIPGRRDARHL